MPIRMSLLCLLNGAKAVRAGIGFAIGWLSKAYADESLQMTERKADDILAKSDGFGLLGLDNFHIGMVFPEPEDGQGDDD